VDPGATPGFRGSKEDARTELEPLRGELERLQELLYAEHRHAVLIVLQGMDSSGKDGAVRRVFSGVDPQGVRVAAFKRPSELELDHDFLWRVHAQVPRRGEIVLFNRSHYEDVLVPRVHGEIRRRLWEGRFRSIVEFERSLVEEGTTVLKFFLHIGRAEQRGRLQDRLDDRTKQWKFREADVLERRRWRAYMTAYSEAISATSTASAPWYVVPSNHKWYRDLFVSRQIVQTLRHLRMRYPGLPRPWRSRRIR
jgi:PPK2 family polyphosphate:nucleotide phosphotransferase